MKLNTDKKPCTGCFKVLGVPSRMTIYNFLTKNDKATVTEVVAAVKLRQPTVSYHLKEMKKSGLLASTKVGKKVFYSLRKECPDHNESCVLISIMGGTKNV